jgi:HAD superfamily hydrolase (TIGR01509 family)
MQFFHEQRYDCFYVVVFSCVEGAQKPQREIYEVTLKKLGCQAAQAVLIDDYATCVEAAKALGLNAILFESPSQVKSELARLGVKTD